MRKRYSFRAPRWGLSLVAGSLLLSACGDGESVTEPEPTYHADDVEGVQLVASARTIATYDGPSGTWNDSFEIDAGELSGHIDVRFVDGSGNAVPLGDDFYLEVVPENPSIATYFQDDPGGFGIHIEGVSAGEAGLVFRLMHGAIGTGHADFITEPFEVHVHGPADADAVEGVQLVMGQETIATYDADTEMWSGDHSPFEIDEGETSGHIDVHFVDHDGDALEFGDDYYLEVESQADSIATFIQDDPGGFAIHIRGVAAGETGLVFKLMHGAVGSGHADFETEPYEVHVHDHGTDADPDAPEGVQLVMGGDTIATYDGDTEMWSGDHVPFEIDEGETSEHIDVQFVNHDGDVLEFGDDYYLMVESQADSIATFIQDDPGGFAIHIRGVAAGETGTGIPPHAWSHRIRPCRLQHRASRGARPRPRHRYRYRYRCRRRRPVGHGWRYDRDLRRRHGDVERPSSLRDRRGGDVRPYRRPFWNHDGDVLEFGDDYYLMVESQADSIATFIQDDPGGFAIHIRGVAAGETGLVFRLMHGAVGSGHADFSTEPLEVHVGDETAAIEVGGVQLVQRRAGTIAIYDADTQAWRDTLQVAVGSFSPHTDVHFLDHDDNVIEFGDDYYLEVESQDENIANFQQDNPGGFGIHIRGRAAGQTGFVFKLMHGAVSSGHQEFATEPLRVRVGGS